MNEKTVRLALVGKDVTKSTSGKIHTFILKEMGYYNGELTGYFDSQVEDALQLYQGDNGIDQSGELDELTIRYILAQYYDDSVNDYNEEVNKVINDYSA